VALPPLSLTSGMAALRVLYDREGRTLTVWFSDRRQEHACEEAGEEEKHGAYDSGDRASGFGCA
jgi:hypothetical protein